MFVHSCIVSEVNFEFGVPFDASIEYDIGVYPPSDNVLSRIISLEAGKTMNPTKTTRATIFLPPNFV